MKRTDRKPAPYSLPILYLLLALASLLPPQLHAQPKPSICVVMAEVNGLKPDLELKSLDNLVRMEIERTDAMQVLDKYDLQNILAKNNINKDSCKGKMCLVEAGRLLKADKMLTGNVDRYGERIIVTLRLIDVKTETIEKSQVDDYLNLPLRIEEMLRISIAKLMDSSYDKQLEQRLTQVREFDNSVNNPEIGVLKLSGPRIGINVATGDVAQRLQDERLNGGFDGYPFMSVFGYQFEWQYLNEGNFQALIEFVPAVAGADQNMFIPSFSLMQGFRTNKQGWEFALGPNFSLSRTAKGFYDAERNWIIKTSKTHIPADAKIVERLDSRGDISWHSAFIFAVGRSVRSGRLNIPLNAYVIPNRSGWRIGMSVGFNLTKGGEYRETHGR